MHGSATPRLSSRDPIAARIAALSAEFLVAGPARRAGIAAEVRALMAG